MTDLERLPTAISTLGGSRGSPVPSQRSVSVFPHRAAYVVGGMLVSLVAGLALVRYPPLLVIGAVGSALAVYIVLTRPYVGLLLYTCWFFLRPDLLFASLRPLHAERVLGALTLAGMLLEQHRISRRISIDTTRQTQLLLLLLVPVLLSIPLAYWRFAALDACIDFLKLVAWYLMVVHLINTRLRLRIFLFLFLALICHMGLGILVDYLGGLRSYSQGIERVVGRNDTFGGSNSLATAMAVTIPLLLTLAWYKGLRWFRAVLGAAAGLLTVTMAVTGSRGGLLAFLGGLLFLWWRARHRLLLGIVGAAILAAGVYALPEQYKTRYSTIAVVVTSGELDGSSMARITLFERGLHMIAQRPLTGVGIGCFLTANAANDWGGRRIYMDAHCLYVQVPAEVGILGAVVFFAFVLAAFRLNRDTEHKLLGLGPGWDLERLALRGLAAGLCVLVTAGIFGGNFMRYTWYVYAALGAAIARLYESWAQEREGDESCVRTCGRGGHSRRESGSGGHGDLC